VLLATVTRINVNKKDYKPQQIQHTLITQTQVKPRLRAKLCSALKSTCQPVCFLISIDTHHTQVWSNQHTEGELSLPAVTLLQLTCFLFQGPSTLRS
jgi:hypothetical protein